MHSGKFGSIDTRFTCIPQGLLHEVSFVRLESEAAQRSVAQCFAQKRSNVARQRLLEFRRRASRRHLQEQAETKTCQIDHWMTPKFQLLRRLVQRRASEP